MDSAELQQVAKTDQMDYQEESAASAQAVLSPEAPVHPLLQLQQTIGNMAVQRLARSGAFQARAATAGAAAPASALQSYGSGAAGQALMMAAVQHTVRNRRLPGTASATPVAPSPLVAPLPTPAMPPGAAMERLEPHPEAPSAPATQVAPIAETVKPAPDAAGLLLGMTAPIPAVTEPALQPPGMSMAMAAPETVLAPPALPKTAAPAPTPSATIAKAPRATLEVAPAPVAPPPRSESMATTAPAAPAPVTMPVVVAPPTTTDTPGTAETATPSFSTPVTAAQAQPMATATAPPGKQPSSAAFTSSGATQQSVVAPPVGEAAAPAESPQTARSVKATPTSSKDDPEFQQTLTQLKHIKNVQKHHPKPEVKKQEVQNAALLPENEQKASNDRKAHLETMDKTASQEKGAKKFQAATFKTLLNQELTKLKDQLPENEKGVTQFKKDKPLEQMRGNISEQVSKENQKVAAPIATQTMLQQPPDSGIASQTPGPLQKDIVGSQPRPINPAAVAPKPKQDAEISMEEKSRSLDQLMTKNKLSDEQLANSNEPDFLRALDSKKQAQTVAASVPAQYRAQETKTLDDAQRDARISAQRGMESMFGKRDQTFGAVLGHQTGTKAADISVQNFVMGELKGIYEATKTDVNKIFTNLTSNEDSPTNVIKIFNVKSTAAKDEFEKQVEDQLDDIHGTGFLEIFFDEDTEAIEAVFVREKDKFLATMDKVLDEIAGIIANELNAAIVRIQQGSEKSETFFRSLSTNQQQLAQGAMEMFRTQYAILENSVDDKQTELVSNFAESYKHNVGSLRDTFDKLEAEASKNFLDKAAEFVVGVAEAVYNLGKLLLSIVSRIAGMIDEILAHPIRFLENLAAGIKQGFTTFIGNIDTYLLKGFFDWLRGSVGSMGFTLPDQFDEKGLFGLATNLIGLNVQTFKEVVVRKLGAGGERIVAVLEKGEEILGEASELFRILKTEGIGGLWTHLKEMILSHLSEVFNRIKETVLYETIKKVLMFVASLFTPVGAFIKAVQALYAGLKFLMDNIERIATLVNAFLDSIELAVKGDTGGIANKIITVLSNFIVIGIDFLAKLLNLGNLADKVRKIIQAVKAPVIRAMEWLVDKFIKPALNVAQKAGKAVKAGVAKVLNWWAERRQMRLGDGEIHTLRFTRAGQSVQLILASEERPVQNHLQEAIAGTALDKAAKGRARDALQFFVANIAPIMSQPVPDNPPLALQAKIDALPDNLNRLSAMLAAIDQDTAVALPAAKWSPLAPQSSGVELLSNRTSRGGQDARAGEPEGWALIVRHGLTRSNGNWVRMHMISAGIGGKDIKGNLLPAPTAVNTGGDVRGFERQVERMLYGDTPSSEVREARSLFKRLKQRNAVIWVETTTQGFWPAYTDPATGKVLYDATTFATSVSFKAGMHFPRNNDWAKDPAVLAQAQVVVPQPNFTGTYQPNINEIGEPTIAELAGIGPHFAREIVEERGGTPASRRPHTSSIVFANRMRRYRLAQGVVVTKPFEDALNAVVTAIQQSKMKWRN